MLIVITYDVSTVSVGGEKRLKKVSQICEHYGIRVQNSVFEVLVDASQLTVLKHELKKVIDEETDSVRFYRLGNSYQNRIDTLGKISSVETGQPLLL